MKKLFEIVEEPNNTDVCVIRNWKPLYLREVKDGDKDFKDYLKKHYPEVIENFDFERAVKLYEGWKTAHNAAYGEQKGESLHCK